MNLKEAFRYQNKLQAFLEEAQNTLDRDSNVTRVENTYLRHKVNAEAEDETVLTVPDTEYYEQITDLTRFMLYLLDEKAALSAAIRKAKDALDIDMDGEVSLNAARQRAARTLQHMNSLRSSEQILPNGGVGYRFNAEGNQVSYRCDVKRVTTINFDRNVIRRELAKLNQRADETSAKLDLCLGGLRASLRRERRLCRSLRSLPEQSRGVMPRPRSAILGTAGLENTDTGSGADER